MSGAVRTAVRTVVHHPKLRARTPFAVVLWVVGYVLFVILPLPLSLINLDPGRGFWTNFSVSLGFVGLSMFGVQFLMGARTWIVAHPIGMDMLLGFHRKFAYLATLLVFAHPIILFVIDPRYLGLLDVLNSPLRSKFGIFACLVVLLVIALSVFRQRFRIRYETWQMTHAILAVLVVLAALIHVLLVEYYVGQAWEQALWVVLSVGFIGLGVWVRIIKPFRRRHRRWTVEQVIAEPGGSTTIALRLADPTSYGAPGFRFEAGQFAWIQARGSAFALSYHPFSFSSSAEDPHRLTFTVKPRDGFSREVGELAVGDNVYLDGPFGAFVIPGTEPLVVIGAGVGVTPLVSMLETIADRTESPTPMHSPNQELTLWLGNRDETSIACRDQIEALRERLNLTVVHVLSHPGPDWSGARGHIDAEFVSAQLDREAMQPDSIGCWERSYLLCGPDSMMDEVERCLRDAGVPETHVHSERFDMV